MKKKILITAALAILLAWPLGSAFAYESLIGPTGVLQWDKTATQEDMILLTSIAWTKSYMIDREGYIINAWETGKTPVCMTVSWKTATCSAHSPRLRPIAPGLERASRSAAPARGRGDHLGRYGRLAARQQDEHLDSASHLLQEARRQHADPALGEEDMREAYAMGRDAGTCSEADGLWPDAIEEVDATPYPGKPKVVRKWNVWDRTVQDRIPGLANYGNVKDPKKFHLNFYPPNPSVQGLESRKTRWSTTPRRTR